MKLKGFSLVEVIVAVAIFAIILIPIGIAFNQSMRVTSKSKENMDIAQVLNKAMEKMYADMGNDDSHFADVVYSLPDYSGSELEFGNDKYKVKYTVKRIDCDFDLILVANASNTVSVYQKVYDATYGGVKYDLSLSIPPSLSGVVNIEVYKEISGIDRAEYRFNNIPLIVTNPNFKIYFIDNTSTVNCNIDGVFEMNGGIRTSNYTTQLLEVWSKSFTVGSAASPTPSPTASPAGNFTTQRSTVKFISYTNSKFYHQLFEVTMEIWNEQKNRKVREYKFFMRG
ncbi:hypothetical protein COB47_1679 [Caldicellulosiruptor obsidiansis OB47]|uniref:Prepilin-type N-terminal cleavage/methylation domain-containing protein n=1 Tax=Caldicellulosiruptor obsidiansis (strain ATCC BAA-2073 / JCM 16842 / OB47) TaxID=608506 RepID=D9TFI9_CALOO|nr:type II secretion system protein [Caldicellulosiruptor obsidiansis]ADL42959.1 hypothetical protein COB47_1679 [Caldicellulosiruptor obsidiansis OB47]